MKYLTTALISITFLVTLFLFTQTYPAYAQVPSATFTTSLENIKTDTHTVTGNIHIANTTGKTAFDIHTIIQLQSPTKTGSKVENGKLIAFSETGLAITTTMVDTFTLAPGQEVTKPFTLSYPQTIPSTNYTLFITLQDDTGKVLGIATNQIALTGSNQFLTVDTNSCKITADGVPYLPTDAPIIGDKTVAKATCSFTNTSSQPISTTWKMLYQADPTITNVFTNKNIYTDNAVVEIAPNTTKTLSFSFPNVTVPQVYEGTVTIYNEQNQQVSPEIEFRWTVPGPSARIRLVESDKKSYTTGETAHISVTADQSLDLFWLANPYLGSSKSANFGTKLQNPSVAIQIYNSTKQLCGEKTQNVVANSTSANWPTQKLDVSITKDCQNPIIQAKIIDQGKELAKKEQKFASADETNTPKTAQTNYWMLSSIVLLILVGAAIVWFIKKRKKTIPPSTTTQAISCILILLLTMVIFTKIAPRTILPVYADNDNMGGGNGNTNDGGGGGSGQPTVTPGGPTVTPAGPTATPDPNAPTPTPYFYTTDYTAGMGLVPHAGENIAPGGLFMVRSWQYRNPVFMVTQLGQLLFYPDGQMGTSIVPNPDGSYTVNLGTSTYQNGCGNIVACVQAFPEIDGSSEGITINGVATNEIELYQQRGGASFVAHANSFVINKPSATSCTAHTVKIKLALCGGYAYTGGSDETTWWWHDSTLNSDLSIYPEFKQGNNCVSTLSSLGTPMQTCFGSLTKAVPATTCTVTPTPGPVITPTSAPTCNKACSTNAECQFSSDGCTACLPNSTGGKSCQPGPTATPILACNKSCTNAADCALGVDGCTACLPNSTGTGNVCAPVPACGTACTDNKQCAGAKDSCSNCNAGKCSTFSPDMCKCDGMDFTLANGKDTFFPGDNVTFIAFGKVEGADINTADLKSMKFSLFQSKLTDPNTATRIAQSSDITPTIVSSDTGKVRYKVTWDHQIPASVPSGTLFRIQADITCAAKPGVLGAKTTIVNDNYFTKLYDSIASLFSAGNVLSASDQQIQLNPFYPGAKIQEKSCKIIKFFFE